MPGPDTLYGATEELWRRAAALAPAGTSTAKSQKHSAQALYVLCQNRRILALISACETKLDASCPRREIKYEEPDSPFRLHF
eukprot:728831-Rhodomonas_salina.3